MIIDFHTHCFADPIAKAAINKLEEFSGLKTVHDGTITGLKQYMKTCNVDKSVVLPVATKPSQVSVINKWAKENTDDTLCFFGALHPDDKDFDKTLKQLKQDGFRGVKLHPDYQNFYADEERMMPLYETLRDLNLILALHSGMDNVYPTPVHCTPLMVRNIVKSLPGLTMVAAHMGAHVLWRDAEELLLGLPVFIDTSYSQYSLEKQAMERMIKKHGAERVLFGTDSPWKKADEEIALITALDLPASDIDKILYQNALTLLG